MPSLEKLQRETPGNPNFDESLVVYSGDQFSWKKGKGSSDTGRLGLKRFPKAFTIRSHKTGVEQRFVPDNQRNEANEFFDGEGTAYYNPEAEAPTQVMIWVGEIM